MATANHTPSSSSAPDHSGAVYESIIRDIIKANPMVAAKALSIARERGDTQAAIHAQLQNWGDDGQAVQVQRALTVLVEYYQRIAQNKKALG